MCSPTFNKQTNSVAWVREQTIPIERQPLVGEVSANFWNRVCRVVSATDPYGRILAFLDRSCTFFFPSSSSIVLTRLSGHRSRPITFQKIWQRRKSKPNLWICSKELWPPDHRGGPPPRLRVDNATGLRPTAHFIFLSMVCSIAIHLLWNDGKSDDFTALNKSFSIFFSKK
jgi:hypothetical protein